MSVDVLHRFYGRIAKVEGDHEPATLDALRDNMKGLAGEHVNYDIL